MNIFNWKFSFIFFVSFLCVQSDSVNATKDECQRLYNLFKQSQAEFNECTIGNAVPVGMCSSCHEQYVKTVQLFHNLTTTNDPKSLREQCSDRFMNQDALNIAWQQYQNTLNLWNSAACSNCFMEELYKPNIKILNFKNHTNILNECLQEGDMHRLNVCNNCSTKFNSLEETYKSLPGSPNQICFEAIDQFNRTSNIWYNVRKCPKREKPFQFSITLEVTLILVGILVLSAMGYGGFYAFNIYHQQENYVEQLDSDSGRLTPPDQ